MIKKHLIKLPLLIAFLTIISSAVFSQEKLDYPLVKKKLEQAFPLNQWDEIIKLGKEANKQGIDFFQLQSYIGSAHFYKQNYFLSIHHLEKARKQNYLANSDSIVMTHLYYSYLFTLQSSMAEEIRKASQLTSIKKAYPLIKSLGVETGLMFPLTLEDLNVKKPFRQGNKRPFYREYDSPLPEYFQSIYAELQSQTKWNFWLTYTHIIANRTAYFSGPENSITNNYSISQNQFYTGVQYLLNRTWSVFVAGNYFTYNTPIFTFKELGNKDELILTEENIIQNNYLLLANIKQQYKNISSSIHGSYLNIANQNIYQGGLSIVYYPFHTVDYYIISQADTKLDSDQWKMMLSQSIGFKIGHKNWAELNAKYGDMTNFNDISGANIYNIKDDLSFVLGGKIKRLIKNKLLISLGAELSDKSYFYGDITNAGQKVISKESQYKQIHINGGLQWIF